MSRHQQKSRLEAEIRWGGGSQCFDEIRLAVPELAGFGNWDAAWEGLDPSPHDSQIIECLIRAVISRLAGSSNRLWQAILLRSLWLRLERLAHRRRSWDEDQDELWQSLVCCLLETAHRVAAPTPEQSLVRKILNGTSHRLHDAYRVRWRQRAYEHPTADEGLIEIAGAFVDPEFERVDQAIDEERCLRQLNSLCVAGGICSTDTLILIATYVYGESLRGSATRCDARYEALRKRRQRARKKLRRLSRIVVPIERTKGPL